MKYKFWGAFTPSWEPWEPWMVIAYSAYILAHVLIHMSLPNHGYSSSPLGFPKVLGHERTHQHSSVMPRCLHFATITIYCLIMLPTASIAFFHPTQLLDQFGPTPMSLATDRRRIGARGIAGEDRAATHSLLATYTYTKNIQKSVEELKVFIPKKTAWFLIVFS